MPIDRKTILAVSAAAAVLPGVAAAAETDLGKILLDARLRYENVDQDGFSKTAQALTLRTRLGYQSPTWSGFQALVEGENVTAIDDRYNSTLNNKTRFPVVSDPEVTQLNRAQVSWTDAEGDAVVGRQRIIIGNSRFVGNSGFRQIETTFDAARLDYHPTQALNVTYAYLDRVHRVFGDESPQGQWRSDSHVVQADLKTAVGTLSGYAFLLAFDNAPTQSSATEGARLAGAHPLRPGLSVTYAAEYAHQNDYRNNPASFDLNYVALAAGLKGRQSWASLDYEDLGGDGRRGFSTPLATLHIYQGWADVFLTTPPNGVRDLYLSAGTTVKLGDDGRPVRLQAVAHDFTQSHGGGRYGREIDLVAGAPITKNLAAELKCASFDGVRPGFADRTKVWMTLELKY